MSIILAVESYRLNSHTYRIIQDNGQDDVTLDDGGADAVIVATVFDPSEEFPWDVRPLM